MIEAKIIADSIGPSRVRLTTFLLTYPRFIHSEFMTHRMISRNSASSRAIPCRRMRSMVWNEPATPIAFSKNQAGMQASEDVSEFRQKLALKLWIWAGRAMCGIHWLMEKLGVHKQHTNRILEPWMQITVVATATDWDNFFALRCHPDAQPEFQVLARRMYGLYISTEPKELEEFDWHLPFVDKKDVGNFSGRVHSVARCARTSFLNHDKKETTFEEDSTLYNRLLGSAPLHASPAEHQAQATKSLGYSGNLRGWIQHRKNLQNENVTKYEPRKI